MQRLQWKTTILAKIEALQNEIPLSALPETLDDSVLYHKVELSGTFMHDQKFLMVGSKQHEGPGFFVVTPFILENDGRMILVNRGFAPEDDETQPQGPQIVTGIIRPNRKKRLFMPDNKQERNVWFYEDLPAMSKRIGTQLEPLIIEQTGSKEKDVYPIPSDGKIIMRNDHLYYAITWFSVCFIGLFMFAVYHRIPTNTPSSQDNTSA